MEAANRREGWKEERRADGKERRNGGAVAAAARRRETGFVVVTVADPSLLLPSCYSVSSPPPPTLLMGDSRVPPFGANYRLVRRWRAAGTRGCAVSGPHSSQFTHQTLPSTIRPLRKVARLLNNSPAACYCWRELNESATFCLAPPT